jgi:hypothetical protein
VSTQPEDDRPSPRPKVTFTNAAPQGSWKVISRPQPQNQKPKEKVVAPAPPPHPEPAPLWFAEAATAGLVFIVAAGLNVVADLNDVRAFSALAEPSTYAWLVLSLICSGGLAFAARTRRRGVKVPLYFRGALALGVIGALLTLTVPLRVLRKPDVQPPAATPTGYIDLSGKTVTDADYADANLRRARFSGTVFRHADFSSANLAEADLRNAVFEAVDFDGARLCGADLRGADLRGAKNLRHVRDWSYAFYDKKTKLPKHVMFLELVGTVKDTGRGLLYMCRANETRRIKD